jgi:hypothetical protein
MTETSTATKSPADELREAEAAVTRAEQELAKACIFLREKRIKVLRAQVKGMGGVLENDHLNLTLATLEQSDAERRATLASQAVAKTNQNLDHCQRRFAVSLRETRTINANQVA